MKKPRRLRSGSREWRRLLKENINLYCPALVECKACAAPTRHGYVCWRCGFDDPGEYAIDLDDFI